MNKIYLILYLISFVPCFSFAQNDALFKIKKNDLIGFINNKGEEVIPPRFRDVGEFINGLAWAREDGYYGYIDRAGKFVIPPIYDFATDFEKDYKIVYGEGGKSICINRKGEVLPLPNNYDFYYYLGDGLFNAYTKTEKLGIIDIQGNLLIDTAFSSIDFYPKDSIAIVENYISEDEDIFNDQKIGVVDINGKFIVPYGKFFFIHTFQNGYAFAEDPTLKEVYIDRRGNTLPLPLNYVASDNYSNIQAEGIFLIEYDDPNDYSYSEPKFGIMNKQGELLIPHGKFDDFTQFHKNRAFASKDSKYYIIDKKGELVSNQAFDSFLNTTFEEEAYCFVKTEAGWGAIDTTGRYLLEPQIQAEHIFFQDSVLFYTNDSTDYHKIWHIWDLKTGYKTTPKLPFSPKENFRNGLINVWTDSMSFYINLKGDTIWKYKSIKELKAINLTTSYHKPFTYCNPQFGTHRKIPTNHSFVKNMFSIEVRPNEDTIFHQLTWRQYKGITLYAVNDTKKAIKMDTRRDGMLIMMIEALDKNGKWREIESWLSDLDYENGQEHSKTLPAHTYWKFSIPKYEGSFKTKLRARLEFVKKNRKKNRTIYSNEFEGSINPAQLWRKDWIWK